MEDSSLLQAGQEKSLSLGMRPYLFYLLADNRYSLSLPLDRHVYQYTHMEKQKGGRKEERRGRKERKLGRKEGRKGGREGGREEGRE